MKKSSSQSGKTGAGTPAIHRIEGDVNLSTGNVDFEGAVHVDGWVRDGFVIKATQDIKIGGGVEAARLHAGGKITVEGGVQAHNKGFISAEGDIITSCITSGKVRSNKNVVVTGAILHSEVFALNKIVARGERGLIAGGLLRAGAGVEAHTIGSHLATPTMIELGVVPEIQEDLVNTRAEIVACRRDLDQTQKAITLIQREMREQSHLSQKRESQLYRLYMTLSGLLERLAAISEKEEDLSAAVSVSGNAELAVTGSILPGVKIIIGEATMFFRDEMEHVRLFEEEGKIVIAPYDQARPLSHIADK